MKVPNTIVFTKSTYLTDNVSKNHDQSSDDLVNKPKSTSKHASISNETGYLSVAAFSSVKNQTNPASSNNYSVKNVGTSIKGKPKFFVTVDKLLLPDFSLLANTKYINLKSVMSAAFFMSGMLLMFYMVHFS